MSAWTDRIDELWFKIGGRGLVRHRREVKRRLEVYTDGLMPSDELDDAQFSNRIVMLPTKHETKETYYGYSSQFWMGRKLCE